MDDDLDRVIESAGHDRRTFLRRLVVGSAFAVPVVASFSMSGIQAVYAQTPTASGQRSAPSSTSSPTTTPGSTTTSSSTTTTTLANSNFRPG
jgi:hypothetical protein